MTNGSLRLRLAVAGAVAIALSLTAAGWGLTALFSAHVEQRANRELETHLDQVLSALSRDATGGLSLATAPADPRFRQPYGGLYWQVDSGEQLIRSRSLWDWQLAVPAITPAEGVRVLDTLTAPDGRPLYGIERAVVLAPSLGGETATLVLAMDRAAIDAAVSQFATDLLPYLSLLGLLLILAGWLQLRVGLSPLAELGDRLAAIRSGDAQRLGQTLPREVAPLASDFDALLDARDTEMAAAQRRAADLAHGLKTPLQALLGESNRLHQAGEHHSARTLSGIVAAMQRHVDRELTRTRVASRAIRSQSDAEEVITQVVDVVARTPQGQRLHWQRDEAAPSRPPVRVAVDAADLAEALGTLLENAARYARARVKVQARRQENGLVEIRIEDDGPGLPEAALESLTARGARIDESDAHTGLGLAICREIAEAAGGALRLENTDSGLRARLTLPGAGYPRQSR
jgi:signal transduction histidine kinase